MPRDGSGTYAQPFPPVMSDTTIESTVYNGYTADVTIDLNTPRPIVVGGTGATSAAAALDNLSGEICKVQVTNYSSHDFKPGSFYSLATASGAPVANHSFAGQCYPAVVGGIATTDMFIEARDMSDSSVPPRIYVRQKIANIWGNWMVPAVGGNDPNFSGTITINGRHFAYNDQNATYILDPVMTDYAAMGSSITLGMAFYAGSDLPGAVYHSYVHTFRGRITGTLTTFLTISPSAATFSVPIAAGPIDAGAITTTAPAAADDSNRVPSTNWVRANVASSNFVAFPQNSRSSSYTLVLSDAGKQIYHPPASGSATYTIPNNITVLYPIGTTIMFVNQGAAVTIAIGVGDTMTLVNSTSTGNRTLSGTVTSMATAVKVGNTSWIIWGFGLT
jgi:hypothetical protein